MFSLLTALTQIGGMVYLLAWYSRKRIQQICAPYARHGFIFPLYFIVLYSIATFTIIPLTAPLNGRVPLPVFHQNLQPINLLTCLMNRHYVRPSLRNLLIQTSEQMQQTHPGTTLYYLDAGFPFFNRFPLLPHLSHFDGKKVDIAFLYCSPKTGAPLKGSPSWYGYGVAEGPLPNENNTTQACLAKGFWQYNMLTRITPQYNKTNYHFDMLRTRALINLLTQAPECNKLFIEPHLKQRMHLTSSKVRFQGCRAVRHDDHIHIELR